LDNDDVDEISTDASWTEQEATNEVSSTSEEEIIDGDATHRDQFEFENVLLAEEEVYFL